MESQAIILTKPGEVQLGQVRLKDPARSDIVVAVRYSGVSTGTEKLFFEGSMPPFPGMGFPLVPGYEACGEVVEASPQAGLNVGDYVFVPGANCYHDAFGLFGASSKYLVTDPSRVSKIDSGLQARGALLALAATARHALASPGSHLPDLIIGHGVLGRLLARLTILAGAPAPTVWEIDPRRMGGALGYKVCLPDEDERRDYRAIYDASGNAALIDAMVGRLIKGGEIVLAGFYADRPSFAFAPAFMKEARIRIASEWSPADLLAVRMLLESDALSLEGLITHEVNAAQACESYPDAFANADCLKMIFNWGGVA
ncbi:MAG: chlorophyll synthesis pathway protein BchC [Alphaproteobacteria bacterium]